MASSSLNRRTFLKAGVGTALAGAATRLPAALVPKRQNILIITTDEQSADAMTCSIGHDLLYTPNIDSLALTGMRFTRAYAANPLCVPSRTSMYTGRYPVETGVETNDDLNPDLDASRFPCMGTVFEQAGYRTAYFGKWHLPYPVKDKNAHGFQQVEDRVDDRGTVDEAAKFLGGKNPQPFLAVASFLNPHNICNWARGEELSQGPIGPAPQAADCPPLRVDFPPQKNEPDIMTLMRESYQRSPMFPVGNFSDEKWRQYEWAYYRIVEKVDALIGKVLQAVQDNRLEEDTLIVFLSDHGDCQGAHHWSQETVFYEESVRVPFILKWKGKVARGTSDRLVSTGVDLIPTLCGLAGIPQPKGLRGLDLTDTATGRTRRDPREYVVASNHMVQGAPVDGRIPKPRGRMVRGQRYKYCVYDEGKHRESLVDLASDPGEMVNLAGQPHFQEVLKSHRRMLMQWETDLGYSFPIPQG